MIQLTDMIRGILDAETNLHKEDGLYVGQIYADYRDEISEETMIKIFKHESPREAFEEILFETYFESEAEYQIDVMGVLEKHWDEVTTPFCEVEDKVRDWVSENVYFNLPYQHFLDQSVYVDVLVDTGDANYDFTRNELFGCNRSERGVKDNSSLVWLMKQQGYRDDQILGFVGNEDFQGSKLLESIYHECINTGTCMNALAFLVEMSLEELFDLHEKVQTREGAIKLSKETRCGLYDPWNGAGSCLEIELENDVILPVRLIDSALPDGGRGYSVSEIFGVSGKFWSYGSATIQHCEE